jgi:hypothetical protein
MWSVEALPERTEPPVTSVGALLWTVTVIGPPVGDVRRFGGQLVAMSGRLEGRRQRQGAHRADRDRDTRTASFVTERHLTFDRKRAISA